MRSHFTFPDSYVSKLADKSRKNGVYNWNKPIERHLPHGIVQCGGEQLLMLAGYSYLGYITDEGVRENAAYTFEQFGLGTHGTRPNCGTTVLHNQLETALSVTNRSESTTLFPSGFQANFSTISAIVGKGDLILGDELNHASIVDGCHLAEADFTTFKHNNMDELVSKLKEAGGYRNRLIIVDSVFSMDGDLAPIPELCQICEDYSAVLMVDEAHSFGVLGEHGFGIMEYFDLSSGDVDIITGVLSKTVPGTGGYTSGCAELGDFLKHNAKSYIFSGAIAPFNAAVSLEVIRDMTAGTARVQSLWDNTSFFHKALTEAGADISNTVSPITPIVFGDSKKSLKASQYCIENGVFLIGVPFPLVPMGKSRLRATVTADHRKDDLERAVDVISNSIDKFLRAG